MLLQVHRQLLHGEGATLLCRCPGAKVPDHASRLLLWWVLHREA